MSSELGTSNLNTFGIGRFLIDFPAHFQLLAHSSIELVFGTSANSHKVGVRAIRTSGTVPTFDAIVAERTNQLRASHHYHAKSQSRLIDFQRINDKTDSPVVVRFYDDAGMNDSFTCEIFVERGESVNVFFREIYTPNITTWPKAAEAQLIDMVEQMHQFDSKAVSGPGVGLGKVLLRSAHSGEYVSASFRSPQFPEVTFSFTSRSLLDELDGGLLERVNRNAGLLSSLGFRSNLLRRGRTTLGSAPAEELLESGQERGKTVRSFTAEVVLRKPATIAEPLLTLDAKMGGQVGPEYVEPKLSETDALALWDFVRASVRPRPGAV